MRVPIMDLRGSYDRMRKGSYKGSIRKYKVLRV